MKTSQDTYITDKLYIKYNLSVNAVTFTEMAIKNHLLANTNKGHRW